ncbi:MAG: HigA family addiction module antidote protein [Candidatus Rokubacteria bacterium]|nr:HigA family addiction module antidote protein [Candidatus Rokubacteria bacterium]
MAQCSPLRASHSRSWRWWPGTVNVHPCILQTTLNGRAGISPEMAIRLSIASGTSAESWLNQQTQYDLWHAEQGRKQLRVTRLAPA